MSVWNLSWIHMHVHLGYRSTFWTYGGISIAIQACQPDHRRRSWGWWWRILTMNPLVSLSPSIHSLSGLVYGTIYRKTSYFMVKKTNGFRLRFPWNPSNHPIESNPDLVWCMIYIYIYTQIDIDIWYRYRYIYILDIDIDRFRYRYTRLPWLHMTTMSLSIPVASLWLVMEIPASPGVFRSYLFGIQKRSIRKLRCRYRKWIWMNILPIWIVYL